MKYNFKKQSRAANLFQQYYQSTEKKAKSVVTDAVENGESIQ
jgi:hypothetical protein